MSQAKVAKSCCLGKGSFDNPASQQQNKAALDFRQFYHMQGDALLVGCFGNLLTGTTLIDVGQGHIFARGVLDRFGEASDFLAIADIGGRDLESQRVAERIDGHVYLGAPLTFGAVIASPCAAFRG